MIREVWDDKIKILLIIKMHKSQSSNIYECGCIFEINQERSKW